MEVSGQLHAPAVLLPGRLGSLQSQSARGVEEKNSQPTPGIEPDYSIVEPVVSRCTDWAIPPYSNQSVWDRWDAYYAWGDDKFVQIL
jgi:hypothetical protein